MGEILQSLIEQRNRLIQKKQQITNFNMTALNQQITKLNVIIQKIQDGGWD